MTVKSIKATLLKLPLATRAELAASLLSSLENEDPADVEQAWLEEAQKRCRAYEKDPKNTIPSQQAFAMARAALRK